MSKIVGFYLDGVYIKQHILYFYIQNVNLFLVFKQNVVNIFYPYFVIKMLGKLFLWDEMVSCIE